MRLVLELATPADTERLGRAVGRRLRAGDVVVLSGPLGAGKTVLARGIGAGLGVRGPITSPTFVIAREHPALPGGRGVPLVHVDTYRLGGIAELDDLDLDTDLLAAAVVVEWGEGIAERLADDHLLIRLQRRGDDSRVAQLCGPARFDPGASGPSVIRKARCVLVLAVDTATSGVIAGLARLPLAGEPQLLAERVAVTARAHGELLMPSVCEVMTSAGLSLHDLDAVVCGAGPGPFTGLRVGMVTAAALGDALSVPVYPVCSLDAIAYRAGAGSSLLVITDARRREVYWAHYDDAGVRVDGPHVDRPVDLPLAVVSRVVGAAGVLELPVAPPRHPDPAALVAVAAPALRSHAPPGPLIPFYLRRPDAVTPGPAKRVTPA